MVKESPLKTIKSVPELMPDTSMSKFKIPKSKNVFKAPTNANLAASYIKLATLDNNAAIYRPKTDKIGKTTARITAVLAEVKALEIPDGRGSSGALTLAITNKSHATISPIARAAKASLLLNKPKFSFIHPIITYKMV